MPDLPANSVYAHDQRCFRLYKLAGIWSPQLTIETGESGQLQI
jgi:hypothetical protein